jgi:FAD synthase
MAVTFDPHPKEVMTAPVALLMTLEGASKRSPRSIDTALVVVYAGVFAPFAREFTSAIIQGIGAREVVEGRPLRKGRGA